MLEFKNDTASRFHIGDVLLTLRRSVDYLLQCLREVIFPIAMSWRLWLPPSVACAGALVRPMPDPVLSAFAIVASPQARHTPDERGLGSGDPPLDLTQY
jgi:hypothetical protein